ncbi:MAG: AAA family ATPase [Acidobacteriaceae bacterium]
MFLAELLIENFRIFGEGLDALTLSLKPGLTALIGENDTGKTAVMDAIRFALGTRDQEFIRVEESDFHQPPNAAPRKKEIRIRCKFAGLSLTDIAAFTEYLTYEPKDSPAIPVLYINWHAVSGLKGNRRFIAVETRSGLAADGPSLDAESKVLLCATYLRPLRDAERALSAGRGSRLSQILQHTKEINECGTGYDHANPPADPSTLSVLGIADYANVLLGDHAGIRNARKRLNDEFLKDLSFHGNILEGSISVSGSTGDPNTRLRQLLEKLDLELRDRGQAATANRGLGSNNLLFMACELLLLGSEADGFPLLLVEEPEAHLHPQRQLRLMQFLQQKAKEARADSQRIQIIVTTHSPNLASAIQLDNLVLLSSTAKAFPLCAGCTKLDPADYGFLSRFLDVTKANLFFARGLVIVEGDAENILLPTLARMLQRDFTANGVSIVNVGGIGLRRFARIYQRKDPKTDGVIPVPVACVTDLDVMPNCAPEITGRVKPGEAWPAPNDRRWRARRDYTAEELRSLAKIHAPRRPGRTSRHS